VCKACEAEIEKQLARMEANGEFAGYKDFQTVAVKEVIAIRLRCELECPQKKIDTQC